MGECSCGVGHSGLAHGLTFALRSLAQIKMMAVALWEAARIGRF